MKVLAACLCLLSCLAGLSNASSLEIVSFGDSLELMTGRDYVHLRPGAPGRSIEPGSEVSILSGEAVMAAEGGVLRAPAGTRFVYALAEGRPSVTVTSGALEIQHADGRRQSVSAGELVLFGPPAPAAPQAPAQPEPPAPTPAAAATAVAPQPAVVEEAVPAEKTSLGRLLRGEKPVRFQIELHPYYSLRTLYDTNIYLVPREQPGQAPVGGGVVGSWITVNNLGVKLLFPINRRHQLEAGYDFKASHYAKQSRANNAYDQSVSAAYAFQPRRAVKLRAADSYVNTEDPAFSEIASRERRWQNDGSLRLELAPARGLVYGVDAQHTLHKYLSPTLAALLDRQESLVGGDLGMMVQPKTRVYAAYHLRRIHYSAGRQADSRTQTADLGVDGALTPKLSGRIQSGLAFRRYDALAASTIRTLTFWQASARLGYKIARTGELALTAYRSVNEATFVTNRFYVSTGGALSGRHKIKALTLGADGGAQVDRYPELVTTGGSTDRRLDEVYTIGTSAEYALRTWLTLAAAYTRLQRSSNFSGQFNYVSHRTSLELKASF